MGGQPGYATTRPAGTSHPEPNAAQASKDPKIFRALEGVWKLLPDEARQEMTKVGFKPPAAAEPTAEESLLAMLQAHEAELPQEIRAWCRPECRGRRLRPRRSR